MKQRNPISKNDLSIKKKDRVLEVGSGHNPTRRADVIMEKFLYSNYHRSGNIRIFPHQYFINADAEKMPFKDKEFDYVICNHVLEHAEDPVMFVDELQRVAVRGYIEVPSFVGESLFPKKSHKWVCLEIDGKLVLYEKSRLPEIYPDYGTTFLDYLPYKSLALRIFYYSYHQAYTVRYEWKDSIDIIVNPAEAYYKDFFTKSWTNLMRDTIFPSRSKWEDIAISLRVFFHMLFVALKEKLGTGKAITLDEYMELKNKKKKP